MKQKFYFFPSHCISLFKH